MRIIQFSGFQPSQPPQAGKHGKSEGLHRFSVEAAVTDIVCFSGGGTLSEGRKAVIDKILERLGLPKPKDEQGYNLYNRALTPAGKNHEGPGENSERLEFVGDGVLGLAVESLLFERFPDWDENRLSKLSQLIVCNDVLAILGRSAKIHEAMNLGHLPYGAGDLNSKKLADCVEALYGAAFLQGENDLTVIRSAIRPFVDAIAATVDIDKLDEGKGHKRYVRDLPDRIAGKRLTVND